MQFGARTVACVWTRGRGNHTIRFTCRLRCRQGRSMGRPRVKGALCILAGLHPDDLLSMVRTRFFTSKCGVHDSTSHGLARFAALDNRPGAEHVWATHESDSCLSLCDRGWWLLFTPSPAVCTPLHLGSPWLAIADHCRLHYCACGDVPRVTTSRAHPVVLVCGSRRDLALSLVVVRAAGCAPWRFG